MQRLVNAAPETRRAAWILLAAGLVPFALFGAALLLLDRLHPLLPFVLDAFRLYGAVILSFLGGIRWGAALHAGPRAGRVLGMSLLAPLAGWAAVLLPPAAGIALLVPAYCAQGAWDSFTFHNTPGMAWFARLRIVATLLVVAAHVPALVAAA